MVSLLRRLLSAYFYSWVKESSCESWEQLQRLLWLKGTKFLLLKWLTKTPRNLYSTLLGTSKFFDETILLLLNYAIERSKSHGALWKTLSNSYRISITTFLNCIFLLYNPSIERFSSNQPYMDKHTSTDIRYTDIVGTTSYHSHGYVKHPTKITHAIQNFMHR